MIHEEPVAIADNTEALADEEALTENYEPLVEHFSYSQGSPA